MFRVFFLDLFSAVVRFLVGAEFFVTRINSEKFINRSTERLLIGPSGSYYFAKDRYGAVFVKMVVGYTKFRESSVQSINAFTVNEIIEGQGGGFITELGYAYVLNDRISFDLSIGAGQFWIFANQKNNIDFNSKRITLKSSELVYTFGFNVLLDKFFF